MIERTSGLDLAADDQVLDFEERYFGHRAPAAAIRERFGCSEVRYLARLLRIVETPEALRSHPRLVGAIRARRDRLRSLRSGRAPAERRGTVVGYQLTLEGRSA